MPGFYIKKVTANSAKKGDASVTFGKGLNIIQGRSDSGKTCVANCIDFIYGGQTSRPFKDSAQYDSVTMIVAANDEPGDVTLRRTVGKNQVEVDSTVAGIESGIYDVSPRKNAKNPPLNEVWLRLIGTDPDVRIVANSRFETKRLTWKNLLRVFYLDEGRVDDAESIVEPSHRYMENTLFLSALLYLFTGRTFTETDAQEKSEIKNARRKAVKDYVNRKIQDAAARKAELGEKLHLFDGIDIDAQIEEATNALDEIRRKIDRSLEESQRILSSISSEEQRIAECNVLLNRYNRLSDQYRADIQRLSLIAEGEESYEGINPPLLCPYCDNPITPRKRQTYMESARITMERTMDQLNGLVDTEKDVKEQKKESESNLEKLKSERDSLEAKIKMGLRPQESKQLDIVRSCKAYLQVTAEIGVIESYSADFGRDLDDIENEQKNDKPAEYHPKEYFPDDFVPAMSGYAQEILEECHYSGLLKANFDLTKFDIVVNGEDKGTSHGKGYRSYLNTVMILMLRKYLANHAKFNPRSFIIDTPLHGFDDGLDEDIPDSMRAGLYRYFMAHQDEGQLIIIENLDHIPHLDYEASDATVTTFEKTNEPGKRYGFLNGVK